MSTLPGDGDATAFIQHLYAGTGSGWLTVVGFPGPVTRWVPLAELNGQVTNYVAELAPTGDVYFGIAPRREVLAEGKRGGKDDCLSLPGLWLDIDIKHPVHAHHNLPPDSDTAVAFAHALGLEPTAIIYTGHGIQPLWLLQEPLDAEDAEYWLSRWRATWLRLASERGWHLDDVWDLPRILRMPGTTNRKAEPVDVTINQFVDRSYGLDHLDEVLDDPPRPRARSPRAGEPWPERDWINQHYTCHDIFREAGWTQVGASRGRTYYRRPCKPKGHQAVVYPDGGVTVWTDASEIAKDSYDTWGLYVHAFHKGDWNAANTVVKNHILKEYTDQAKGSGSSGTDTPPPLPRRRLLVVTNTQVERKRLEWLWEGWLPRAKLIGLEGDPDQGKSTVMVDIAARISTGALMPDGSPGVPDGADVLLLSGEDDVEDTTSWRLDAAGADGDRIHHVTAAMDGQGECPVTIPRDLDLIEALIEEHQVALVVIDVLFEYLDGQVDSYRDHQIRRVLHGMKEVARRTRAAIVFLRHFRKERTDKAIHRGGGSIGIIAAARAGWVVAPHPDNEELRVLAAHKMNVGRIKPVPRGFILRPHHEYPVAYVDWQGEVNIGADALLNPTPTPTREAQQAAEEKESKAEFCERIMQQLLTLNDEMWTDELWDALVVELHIGKTTYENARAKLTHVVPDKKPDGTKGYRVRLKTPPSPEPL